MNSQPNVLDTSVQYIKGVGPKLAKVLNRLGIFSIKDLLYYFPRAYEDRRQINKIKDLNFESKQMFLGTLEEISVIKTRRYQTIVKGLLNDGTGQIQLLWFNQGYLTKVLKKGLKLFVLGKPQYAPAAKKIQLVPQEFEIIKEDEKKSLSLGRVLPKYFLTENLSSKKMRRIVYEAFKKYYGQIEDFLPESLRRALTLTPLRWSLMTLHFPRNFADYQKARRRLVFEEFFLIQLSLMLRRLSSKKIKGIQFLISPELFQKFQDSLPFRLTGDQQKAIQEIFRDMSDAAPMRRLLQGDVGSGKTAVAAAAILAAAESGYQSAFMAPTEILASQHFRTVKNYFKNFKIQPVLLISGLKASQKAKNTARVKNGTVKVVIGTHALIQEKVKFKNLGLAIVDEQHRFGVEQRLALVVKGNNPDLLVMTATPIPRTLALTFYGDLEQSIIKEMPAGRIPIQTYFVKKAEKQRVYEFIKKQVASGEQAFIVFPLVAESEKLDLKAATEACENFKKGVFSEFREAIALVHGQMKQAAKDQIMKNFASGKIKILVATTVVEVGVDVPEATLMVIENAERFGLAVLHQLRGRVGRGDKQAYCILIGDPKTPESKKRIKTIISTTDGFEIAEVDLKIRGPGEVLGLRQSGFPEFKIANPVGDLKILAAARLAAQNLISADPFLKLPENQILKEKVLTDQVFLGNSGGE